MMLLSAVRTSGQETRAVAADYPRQEPETEADFSEEGEGTCSAVACRANFLATLFLGSAIDKSAASNLQANLNPDTSGDVDSFERLIGGLGLDHVGLSDFFGKNKK